MFTYQTLDNIDGKQARKTGNSSPLGMLFDHGCDAFALIFIVLGVARVVCFSNEETILYVGFVGCIFGFYFSVWCQYYSKGILILGEINAPDDGIPAISIISVITYFCGQKMWIKILFEFWDI
jgi:ethanolaminephosphotransferase